ncbi:hypothetical protein [Klebsiella oxytoca]|uniref:hypothetical protein n=2 Tax=Klebsiella oxytoca TaxID=571 RepID=UPI001157F2B8|nr:hypothetical protein [Klebsiella oxytoca]
MSTYKTGHPLGSAAVKDLFDNAENLDFALNSLTALIWTDRLGKTRRSFFGMESAFVTQLSSQESRFNTFIQSSGYQIVGDYTAGPLTLTDYNQLIRYNNELYKLTAATDIPFTTAGNTDETWTSTDAAHFVSVGDAALRQNLGSSEPGMGGDLSAWRRRKMMQAPVTVSGALDSQAVSIWEFAGNITDRPDINDPGTWDWSPAFQAAADAYIAPRLISGEKYTMRSTVTITVDTTSPTRYVKVPFCNDGLAIIDHSSLGNAGEGFNDALPVDDPSQPVRVPAFIIAGGSGTLLQQHMEGIYFIGNKNTCSVILKGCCGVRIVSCIFNANRQGIVFSNDVAAGVFTEACVAYNCRFRQACLVAITYEKGAGDSSFHGTGFDQTYITSPSGYPTILIGTGAQPYNAPVNGNIWTAGTAVAMIQNKGLTSHFYGSIKLEGSPKAILASDSKVFLYGEISTWSIVDKGTLVQAVRGGPTGPSGGNLQFAGITAPEVTRWDVAAAGTVVPFAAFNEKAIVTVRGSNYYATFEFSTSRHATGNAVSTPLLVSASNCNPLTKFKIAKTAGGLSLTTVENNTIITAYRWENMPDESSGMNFRSAGYWRKL